MKKKFNTKLTKMLSNIYICPTEDRGCEKRKEVFGKKNSTSTFIKKKRDANDLKMRFEKGRNTYFKLSSSKKVNSRSKNPRNPAKNSSAYSLKNTFADSFCKKKSKKPHPHLSLTKRKKSRNYRMGKIRPFGTQSNQKGTKRLNSCSEIFILINKKMLDKERKKQLEERLTATTTRDATPKLPSPPKSAQVVIPKLAVQKPKETGKGASGTTHTTQRSINDRDLLKNEISEIAYQEPSSRFLDEDTSDILQDLKRIAQKIKTDNNIGRGAAKRNEPLGKKFGGKTPVFGRKRLGVYGRKGIHFVKISKGRENSGAVRKNFPVGL